MIRQTPFILLILLFSCSKTDKYRDQIENISDRWELIASEATDLSLATSDNIKNWQNNYQDQFSSIEIDSLSEDEKSQLDQLKIKCLGHGDVYVEIQEIMDSRIKDIEARGLKIQELMLALESDKFPDNVDNQLDSLNQFLDSTELSIEEYNQLSAYTISECNKNCGTAIDGL